MPFDLSAQFKPTGDQPAAIEKLVHQLRGGVQEQVLLGVTGSGKTFTAANVIAQLQRPTLIISHNKTLAAQLYQELKEFFPHDNVHYFVSYYDYYQPEAYLPQTDTYIEKDADINEEIDRLRHAATQSILSFPNTIVIASVSCIYGVGNPATYLALSETIREQSTLPRHKLLKALISMQYARNDLINLPGTFMVRGESLEITSPSDAMITKIDFWGDTVERITLLKNNVAKEKMQTVPEIKIFPAKHFVTPEDSLTAALNSITIELDERLAELKAQHKELEYQRLKSRVTYDREMMHATGYCNGIENYSRHIDGRKSGEPPFTLLDYFMLATQGTKTTPFLTFIDESHISVPQIRGMYFGDKARKQTLVDHGFRLPSALDNRPLTFAEFKQKVGTTIYVSATPAEYELRQAITSYNAAHHIPVLNVDEALPADAPSHPAIVQQLIRPTGILDPAITILPARTQMQDLRKRIAATIARHERVLVTTLTKRLAENIQDYLIEHGIHAAYLHSEVKTLERPEILRRLREGKVDVLVGINLLREGLDLPEVSLVAILDADQEGFLRNATTLIQTMGRAARHPQGKVVLYADKMTPSMQFAIQETERRRAYQDAHNKQHGITPQALHKEIKPLDLVTSQQKSIAQIWKNTLANASAQEAQKLLARLHEQLQEQAKNLEFEQAAKTLETIQELSKKVEQNS